ncbi:hypothetical protein Poly41_41040 [Novipirellula artificiosorum]|uniref:Uncharacterized protein n=1 Tax=Novipirellula artificiosorum TaxID=2528016 RepID=A0A5C6DDT6_9BACT|nr:hypothetical protein Poly41_41040 [Novipirellula artificiosorum]
MVRYMLQPICQAGLLVLAFLIILAFWGNGLEKAAFRLPKTKQTAQASRDATDNGNQVRLDLSGCFGSG